VSDDQEEKIVNESSLDDETEMMMMTGRSESAIEDDESDRSCISNVRAINSSYINFKRNFLTQQSNFITQQSK
jgi:hypothetical protein